MVRGLSDPCRILRVSETLGDQMDYAVMFA